MWVIGSVAAVVGLVVVVVALFASAPPVPAPRDTLAPGLPRPAELRRARFPLAWRGYDPRAVDAHLAAVAERYEALYLAGGPSLIARAEATLEGVPGPTPEPVVPATEVPATEVLATEGAVSEVPVPDVPAPDDDAPPPPDEPGDDGATPEIWR